MQIDTMIAIILLSIIIVFYLWIYLLFIKIKKLTKKIDDMNKDALQIVDEYNNWLVEYKICTREEIDEKMKLLNEEMLQKRRSEEKRLIELLNKPRKEMIKEMNQESIKHYRELVQFTERWIKISEKKLEELKQKKDDKLIKKWEDLLESFKKTNVNLYYEIKKLSVT
jgi:cell shape-determining protein MreC